MNIYDQENLKSRAKNLEKPGFNGIKLLRVDKSNATATPLTATLILTFFNANSLAAFADPALYSIKGGHRIKGGKENDQVRVTQVQPPAAGKELTLTVSPIGDYSTYTLELKHDKIDPLFANIDFKFRPGCFNHNCSPEWEAEPKPEAEPAIDYLAKDYDSFKHALITAMMERVPGWQATSEADFDQVLIDLFSAAADELSDFQDRVMNEAYLASCRKRVSLERHARLMDYHIHQGNQATTWLALELKKNATLELAKENKSSLDTYGDFCRQFSAVARLGEKAEFDQTPFILKPDALTEGDSLVLHHQLNCIDLYGWGGKDDTLPTVNALAAGSTQADLLIGDGGKADAQLVTELITAGQVRWLLIQEKLNPATGGISGADPEKRQILHLIADTAKCRRDSVGEHWYVRVEWDKADALKATYCFRVQCPDGLHLGISNFCANLLPVSQGRLQTIYFLHPAETADAEQRQYHYEIPEDERQGVICRLPVDLPLLYQETTGEGNVPVNGKTPPRSTLAVVVSESPKKDDPWEETSSLVHCDDSATKGYSYQVETDEEGSSLICFGNGVNGRKLPRRAHVECRFQSGRGAEGNVGADSLVDFRDESGGAVYKDKIERIWNPLAATNGRAPEPAAEIIRRVPAAYRSRQLRAVTLDDYEKMVEELSGVSRAAARYAWTGSWRTVQIAVDPVGTTTLEKELRERVSRHLEAVRLIGEDVEIRSPRFVPLDIELTICVDADYWTEDVRQLLEMEFSTGYLPDGRRGFFHPDEWTFGVHLRASRITGRVQSVPGIDHVISLRMKRWEDEEAWVDKTLNVRVQEIILVENNADHLERGSITFEMKGGRR